jgi:hypothetical protein
MDFDDLIESESAKLRELHAAVRQTVALRDRSDWGFNQWKSACTKFHSHVSPLDRYLVPACQQDHYADAELLEFVVRILELNPWFFRSGYLKGELITRLKRSKMNEATKERLRRVALDAVNRRATREFKYYCRLATAIANDELIAALESASSGTTSSRSSRARMMLLQIQQHSKA